MTLSRTVGHVAVLALLVVACTSGPGKIFGRTGNAYDTPTTDPHVQDPTRSANEPPGGCIGCNRTYVCHASGESTPFSTSSSSGDNGSSSGQGSSGQGSSSGLGGSTTSSSSSGSSGATAQFSLDLRTQTDGSCGNGLLRFECGGQVLLGTVVVGNWAFSGTGFVLGDLTCEATTAGVPTPVGGGSTSTGGIGSSSSSTSTGGIRFPDAV